MPAECMYLEKDNVARAKECTSNEVVNRRDVVASFGENVDEGNWFPGVTLMHKVIESLVKNVNKSVLSPFNW